MAFSTGKKHTNEIEQTLNKRAKAFVARHGVNLQEPAEYEPAQAYWQRLEDVLEDDARLRGLWKRVVRRVTGGYDELAYGYWGQHVD